ncbi:hypothetical protein Zmor_017585 [Zophobas morio]|uniref:Peptidase A2 domain-containing protein n=1 Tax=Zophobas morio TaxID=2755281 RepID=A0AA38I5K4_9CUCU|nr:hypothetical protein Zmor_017585 [Zophobas morio]
MDTKIDKQKDDIITSSEKFQKEVKANENEIEEIRAEMKDVKTNLENMENIVGRNMMAMEHQLKSELEKSVHECIEDRMKKIENTIKNAATTGSCYVTLVPRMIQPPTYDAQTPWSSCKKQFEAAATANLWEKEQKAIALVIKLCEAQRWRYCKLYPKKIETDTEFEADVKRLVRLAYTNAPPTFQETLTIVTFVNGIRDCDVKKVLQLSRYQTSSEALICALEVEATYNFSRVWHKVRVAETETEENDKLEKLLEKFSHQIINGLAQGRENGTSQTRLSCSITSSEEKHTTEISSKKSAGKLKTASTLRDVLAGVNKAPKEVKIASFVRGSSPTIPGKINGTPAAITIDTGAEKIRLKTVTGESAPIMGQAEVEIYIGQLKIRYRALVAGIEDDFILGMDLISRHGLTVDPVEKPVRLIACQNVKVKGNAETIVPVRTEIDPGFALGIIQPPHTPKKNLMIASALINIENDIPVRVTNVFPKSRNIKSVEVPAVCEPVTKIIHHNRGVPDNTDEERKSNSEMFALELSHLTDHQRNVAREFLQKHSGMFASGESSGRTNIVQHRINTGDAQPIRQAPRRLPLAKQEEAEELKMEEWTTAQLKKIKRRMWISGRFSNGKKMGWNGQVGQKYQTRTDCLSEPGRVQMETYYLTVDGSGHQNQGNVILAYVSELSKKYEGSSVWTKISMLKRMLLTNENLDISAYALVKSFMKRNSSRYTPKQAKTFIRDQINTFLRDACDDDYLPTKVATIFGIFGGCRREELYSLAVDSIVDAGSSIIKTIPITKTGCRRVFTVIDDGKGIDYLKIIRKYRNMRPSHVSHNHFFISCRKAGAAGQGRQGRPRRKCTVQRIGINTLGEMGKKVAIFLNLSQPSLYTGHAFRRSSATFLADSGADISVLKRHGG